jgi:hypothetical protein
MRKNPRQVSEKKIADFLQKLKAANYPHVEATAKLTRSRDIEITIEICDSGSEEDEAADGFPEFPNLKFTSYDLHKLKIRLAPLVAKRYPAKGRAVR